MSKSVKWLVAVLIAITAASLITVVYIAAPRADTDEEDQAEAVKTPSHVSVQNGRNVITVDPDSQARQGIQVTPLPQTSMRAELRGTAVLLAVGELANLRNNYVAARTKFQRDQVDLNVARTQYERIKALYEQDQNMSLKAMQDAEAAHRNTQTQVSADELDAKLQLDSVRQRWGPVVASWVASNTSQLEPVLEQGEFLAQVILPPGEVAKPPATLTLILPGNRRTTARFVSPLPQVNPQIQGISFLYLVPTRAGMAVGMNLVALVPVGSLLRGMVIPGSALVWWQGKAWAYEATSPSTFARQEVPTDTPVEGGYFIPATTFAPGTKLVTAGAQALLSEEFRSQIQRES